MKNLGDKSLLYDLTPESVRQDPNIQATIESLKQDLLQFKDHLNDGFFLYRIDELNSQTLDHLAAQWQPLVWRDSWPIETKRSVLKALIAQKNKLGTLSAVKKALESVGSAAYIREWWECDPPRTPHTFEVIVDQGQIRGVVSADLTFDLRRMIDLSKPVRSQYTFTVMWKTQGFINLLNSSRPFVSAWLFVKPKLKAELEGLINFKPNNFSLTSSIITAPWRVPRQIQGQVNMRAQSFARPWTIFSIPAFRGAFNPLKIENSFIAHRGNWSATSAYVSSPKRLPRQIEVQVQISHLNAVKIATASHMQRKPNSPKMQAQAQITGVTASRPIQILNLS